MRKLVTALCTTLCTTAVAATTLLLVPGSASAAPAYLPKTSPSTGWETPRYGTHYDADITGENFSSAAVGDLDGNGVPDIVAGFPDGTVQAWRSDNGQRWLDFYTGPGAVHASPTLVDYDGDGRLDVLTGNTAGDVVVFSWDKRVLFSKRAGDGVHAPGVFSTPVAVDLDRNGRLDIVVTSWDHNIHAYRQDGSELPGWPVFLQDTSWSSPAVADLDGDGWQEIVFGYDCDGAPGQSCYPNPGGYLGALRHDGRNQPGFPRYIAGQVIWSSPAIADLDGDGSLDIVVGTGLMPCSMSYPACEKPMRGNHVHAFRADGSNLPGWPFTVGRNVMSSPAVGDLDGDGRNDVAVVAEDGFLYAVRGNATLMWKRCTGNNVDAAPNPGGACPQLHNSAAIADVMGDARQEVVVGGEQWVNVFDSAGAVVGRGETVSGTYPMTAAPTVANLGGRSAIIAVTGVSDGAGERGRVFQWTTNRLVGRADWPTFRGSASRSGTLAAPLTVGGEIGEKYDALGGADGFLGAPTSNEYSVRGGRAQRFRGGQIYWSSSTGAHEVHDAILDRYLRGGGPEGPLGLPVSDELASPGGRSADFQRGSVYWSGTTGAWSVQGLIRDRYRALGGPGGTLGYPVSDEYGVPGGRASNFANGIVYWSGPTGARAVQGAILERYRALGGTGGALGLPVSDELAAPGGRSSDFQSGSIYWSTKTNAWSVQGLIRDRYRALGGPGGVLGYPVRDEAGTPGGRVAGFLNGMVFWSPGSGAHAVQGAILARHGQLGGTGGLLGFPRTDEVAVTGGRSTAFTGGSLFWSSATGAKEVHGALLTAYLQRGGPGGSLRLPKTDEYDVPGGKQSDFQGGRLRYDSATGAVGGV